MGEVEKRIALEGAGEISNSASAAPNDPVKTAQHKPATTKILFIHGAWHGAWCWDIFVKYFASEG
jgi:hypothetical protein